MGVRHPPQIVVMDHRPSAIPYGSQRFPRLSGPAYGLPFHSRSARPWPLDRHASAIPPLTERAAPFQTPHPPMLSAGHYSGRDGHKSDLPCRSAVRQTHLRQCFGINNPRKGRNCPRPHHQPKCSTLHRKSRDAEAKARISGLPALRWIKYTERRVGLLRTTIRPHRQSEVTKCEW